MSRIVIAPFSNNPLRDWPIAHFVSLIDLLIDRLEDYDINLIGAPNQRLAAHEIVRFFPGDRVHNRCGRLAWPAMIEQLRAADCVIGNNSGITHLSRALGVATVCIFGGSHQRSEWGPLGENALIVSRAIGCSPCHFHRVADCPYDAACLRDIAPQDVAEAALLIMARVGRGDQRAIPALALESGR